MVAPESATLTAARCARCVGSEQSQFLTRGSLLLSSLCKQDTIKSLRAVIAWCLSPGECVTPREPLSSGWMLPISAGGVVSAPLPAASPTLSLHMPPYSPLSPQTRLHISNSPLKCLLLSLFLSQDPAQRIISSELTIPSLELLILFSCTTSSEDSAGFCGSSNFLIWSPCSSVINCLKLWKRNNRNLVMCNVWWVGNSLLYLWRRVHKLQHIIHGCVLKTSQL